MNVRKKADVILVNSESVFRFVLPSIIGFAVYDVAWRIDIRVYLNEIIHVIFI